MEKKCIPCADIDSTGCHSNIKSSTATTFNTTAEKPIASASLLRSPQMSSKEQQQLQLQTHNNNVSEKKLYESYESSTRNLHNKLNEDDGRGCSISSISTPAADNIALFKDDDSRSGSSDDITTPIVDLLHAHQRHHNHHRHKQQQNSDEDTATETTMATSTNTIEVIQDHRRCQESESTGNVGVGIYLETPVIDEQIVGLNSHDYEKAKPKRLSDEFLLSSEECCDDGRNSSSDTNPILETNSNSSNKNADCNNISNSNSSEILKNSGILNDLLRSVMAAHEHDGGNGNVSGIDCEKEGMVVGFSESQFDGSCKEGVEEEVDGNAAAGGSMSFRFKNVNMDYHPYDKVDDSLTDPGVSATDMAENDVQSMDAIERRDFEHEQRITGGIILKSSSLAKNDRLKLDLVQQSMQNVNHQQRAVSSDSKCTYKDHSTTPTSSRHYSSRLTKSTAKINLATSLSHPEINTNGEVHENEDIHKNIQPDVLERNSSSPKLQDEQQPGTSKSLLDSLSSVAGSSSSGSVSKTLRSAADEEAVKGGFELFSNSNSNDSLASEHSYSTSSSHSLSHLTKQQQQQQQQPGCSEITGPKSLNTEEELVKKAVVQAESIHKLHQKCHTVYEDSIASTSSSARCKYSTIRYIRNFQRIQSTSTLLGNETSTRPASSTAEELLTASSSTVASTFVINANSHSSFQHPQQQLNHDVASGADLPHLENELHDNEFDEETWADCEEGSDEEVCTCHKDSYANQGKRDSSDFRSDDAFSKDIEISSYIQMVSISEDTLPHDQSMSPEVIGLQRKRKFNEGRLMDTDLPLSDVVSGRKRIAYDYASTPRSSQSLLLAVSPSTPLGRRTPRSLIPTRDNPPPELQDWLVQFQRWSHAERLLAVDRLIEHCEPTQVRHMMKVIEPQFQRDFISLLPRELALQVLAYLDPKDLLRAAQTCRSWRFLCDDNLLWKEKCRKAQILTEPKTDRPKRGRAGNMPPIASPWKAAYMRQHIIEMNWRSRPIREPKVLKGHDDHVITCLQFSGNRIVSGSDDNTLKVWSAVTGRCLRTLVGHTGGVWSSQMSGNTIISGSTDRTLKVWDMETGQCVHTLLGHTSTVRCMHLHGKKVVSGSRDATLRVWDIERGSCLHVLVGHLAAVRCVQYDGKLIVSGAYDYMVKIWHPERQECLHTLQGHTNRVYSLQFDGIHVVSGSLDTSIRVWDVETGNCKHTLMGHQSLTSGMELRQNILVSGNADSTVKVWDITSGQCLQTLSGPNKHQSAVTCLQFNSRFVITSSDDGTVKLWDVKTGEFIRNLVALDSGGSGGVVWRIRANDTKLICAVGSRNGTEETKLMVLDFDVEGACVKCS